MSTQRRTSSSTLCVAPVVPSRSAAWMLFSIQKSMNSRTAPLMSPALQNSRRAEGLRAGAPSVAGVSRVPPAMMLFRNSFLALGLGRGLVAVRVGLDRFSFLFSLLGFPQGAQAFHVLANRGRLALDIGHCAHAFLEGEALPIGPGDAFRRGF